MFDLKFVTHIQVQELGFAVDILCIETGLSKSALKNCLNKGAVWITQGGKKNKRIRKAKTKVSPSSRLSIYYDEKILNQPVPEPECIYSDQNYSIWDKPAGLLSQGTHFGDHCSLFRFVEKSTATPKSIYLVHRLDREASGLVLLAHTRQSAALFSKYFQEGRIDKRYTAVVEGLFGARGDTVQLEQDLDGKKAKTIVTVADHDIETCRTLIDITLLTGRYHQIRRHLSGIGHALVGDSRYGEVKTGDQLMLKAYKISFICPFSKKSISYTLNKTLNR